MLKDVSLSSVNIQLLKISFTNLSKSKETQIMHGHMAHWGVKTLPDNWVYK